MQHRLLALGAALLGVACSPPVTPPKDPPQVHLVDSPAVVAAPTLTVKVNVVGCAQVSQLDILQGTAKVRSVQYRGNPTEAVLQPGDFNTFYNALGIAIPLTLSAKATCDDGRTNTSQPVGVRFFPVASALERTDAPALPDAFVAEGGVGNTPVTFAGCIGTTTGTALARVDLAGEVIGANLTPPFPCSYASQISGKSAVTGHRWLLEPGVGAIAFDPQLNITSIVREPAPNFDARAFVLLGVAPDGDAIVWDSKAQQGGQALFRVRPNGGAFPANAVWGAPTTGILSATPVVSQNEVYVASWVGTLGARLGTVVVRRYNYTTGAIIAENNLVTMEYGDLDSPEIPNGAFSPSGAIFYFPFQASGPGSSFAQSRVVACATNAPDCQGAAQRWLSPLLDTVGLYAIPYAQNTLIAVIAAQKTYFLSESTGQVVSFEGKPVTADGALYTHAVQPGSGTDFYLLNGPVGGYPTELIAVDAPDRGELWRLQLAGGGEQPQTALYLALDDSGQSWVRMGGRQVRPFTLAQYRDTKGANPPTP